jgi:nitroreductase
MELAVDAIRKRRSIRRYEEREVTDEQVNRILETAQYAPSWANLQGWQFLVIRDSETRQKVADVLEGNPAQKGVVQAPVLLVVCADPEKSGTQKGKEYYMSDVGIVMDHFMLEAADMGLGTVFIGMFDEDAVREVLGVPDQYRIAALTPLGYPAKQPKERPSKELGEMLHKESW